MILLVRAKNKLKAFLILHLYCETTKPRPQSVTMEKRVAFQLILLAATAVVHAYLPAQFAELLFTKDSNMPTRPLQPVQMNPVQKERKILDNIKISSYCF